MKRFEVTPIGKPRMTQRDVWKKRPCVLRYHTFKDIINLQLNGYEMPVSDTSIIFAIPMPKSWGKKRKETMDGQPHQQTPDLDNLAKALFDTLLKQDSVIWDCRLTKVWSYEGSITINNIK